MRKAALTFGTLARTTLELAAHLQQTFPKATATAHPLADHIHNTTRQTPEDSDDTRRMATRRHCHRVSTLLERARLIYRNLVQRQVPCRKVEQNSNSGSRCPDL